MATVTNKKTTSSNLSAHPDEYIEPTPNILNWWCMQGGGASGQQQLKGTESQSEYEKLLKKSKNINNNNHNRNIISFMGILRTFPNVFQVRRQNFANRP